MHEITGVFFGRIQVSKGNLEANGVIATNPSIPGSACLWIAVLARSYRRKCIFHGNHNRLSSLQVLL